MEKEILTIENIGYDLRKMIRANIVGAVVCAVFLLCLRGFYLLWQQMA